jgi:hypothetical protein
MKKLWLAFLSAWVLMFLLAGAAMAQSDAVNQVPFCGDLSERECAALESVPAAMAELTSGSAENQVELYVTGGPLRDNRLSLQVSTASTFVLKPETFAHLRELQAMSPEALAADQQAAIEAMLLPLTIDTEDTITISFSPDLLALLSARFGTEIPTEIAFHSRLVDGVAYTRLADYAVFGTQPGWMPEWIGIELMAFVPDAIASEVASEEFNIQDAQDALMAPGAAMGAGVVYYVPPEQVAWYADFIQLESLGTVALDGEAAGVYRYSWNIPRYLGGPIFAQQVGIVGEDGQPTPVSRILAIASAILLDGLQAHVTQAVGMEDSYLYSVETQVTWALGIAGGTPLAERPTLGLRSTTINRDLNAVDSIAVPAGAVVPPISLVMQTMKMLVPAQD